MPYDKTAAEKPVSECAGCHIANVADTDMTWIQFYPLLRDKTRVLGNEISASVAEMRRHNQIQSENDKRR